MGKKVLITGATGMIGNLVLQHCLDSQEVDTVTSFVRRPSNRQHDKLQEVTVENFLQLDTYDEYFTDVDIVFYCLGVYTGAVDRHLFRQITIDYPEALAQKFIEKNRNINFCLLSGAGADRTEKSRMMFARDKGIIENRLSKAGFNAFYAFRPGYIYPVIPRQEPNLSYRITRWLYPVIKLMGKNASIQSTELALAIFNVGINNCEQEIIENKDIFNYLAAH